MTFYNQRLPVEVERGATGGPRVSVTVAEMASGHEQRNRNWEQTRGEWDISYGIQDKADLEAVRAVFYVCFGPWAGFRFKDWSDFEIGDPSAGASGKQEIALGDGATTTFQAIRRYTFASVNHDRDVTKIVTGTDRVWINSTELTRVGGAPGAGQYSIDINTGIITTGDTPGGAASGGDGPSGEDVVYMVAEFDVPVRFKTEDFDVRSFLETVHDIPRIMIIETRDIA